MVVLCWSRFDECFNWGLFVQLHSLLDKILNELKDAFWPFQLDQNKSLFLRAAEAANCSRRSRNVSESASELAFVKAAQHRLERGVWTSVRFGDMRRALSGMELPGERHRSLIYGRNLTDVIITGDNGTIDGQGSVWWNWFRTKTLNYTRPHMVELIDSTDVIISNLTFLNSPFWNIHPIYCSKVIVQNLTIIAPLDLPNTDGIDPVC
ncbi:hypothetical protein POM88_005895 [Heracleum sosnowskyi]|uniref:Polygalacturonase n=1 Tax=Heracleum sosnowskyi TaxID=360622 RepID=A0AAD8N4S7_9APIA|nr:hypothetical protein POM88_005895 [Heracleum sosnowskyi]